MTNIIETKRKDQIVICEKLRSPMDNVHIYERQPIETTIFVRNRKGDLCGIHKVYSEQSTYKAIYTGRTTIVILQDGSKGVAKCKPEDKYSIQIGHDIAHKRACVNKLLKEIEELCN